MKNSKTGLELAAILHKKAEELLSKNISSPETHLPDVETLKLIHELDVHQIELEMQNEELLLAKKQAEINAEKHINLYDFAPSAYFTFSKDGEIMELNYRGAKLLGKERSFLKKRRFALFVSDETRPIFNLFLEKIFDEKTKENCEVILSIIPDIPTYVLLSGIPSNDGEQCFVTMLDIGQRKKAEEKIRESEEKYRSLFNTNRDSITIFRINPDGKPSNFVEANIAKTDIFGYTKEELMSLNIRDLEILSKKKTRKNRLESLKSNGRIHFETIIKNKKGNKRNVEIESIFINYGNKPAIMNIIRDITERKQMENNAKKAHENLVTILEAIPDLLFEVDIDGRIYHYHSHHSDLLAIPPDVFLGTLFHEALPSDAANVYLAAIQEANEKGWSTGKQYELDLPQGKHWFELSVSP